MYIDILAIGLMSIVFANGPGDQGSIPGRVIPKTQKMVLDTALLSTQHYKIWSIPGKGVAPSLTPRCSSYRKLAFKLPSIKVANFTTFFIYILIYICVCVYVYIYIYTHTHSV